MNPNHLREARKTLNRISMLENSHHPQLNKLPRIYPDCSECDLEQRQKCSRKADQRFFRFIYLTEFLALVGIIALLIGFPLLAICLGITLMGFAIYGGIAIRHLSRGARPVQAIGCCALKRKERG